MVRFPFVLFSKLKSDQKHFCVLNSLPVDLSVPCHWCISFWAWEKELFFGVIGFLPDKQVHIVDKSIDTLGNWRGSIWGLNCPLGGCFVVCICHTILGANDPSIAPVSWSLTHSIPWLAWVYACNLMYNGSAPCCKHARLFGASIMQSKQAVVSLSTIITQSLNVSATLYESTLVSARLMALQPGHPPPWLSVIWWACLLFRMNPWDENHFRRRLLLGMVLSWLMVGLPMSFSKSRVQIVLHLL